MNTEIFDLGKIGITLGYEYDNKVIYEKLTIVLYKGKSYISTKTTKGVSPEQDNKTWQLIAEAKDAYNMLVDAGKITLTEEEFLEQLIDATKGRYIVQGNIINSADEEDLTVEHSDILGIDTLKLANRPSKNGMGYVIIRKNKSFAEQITRDNTIYEIRYDFNNIETINLKPNCVLKFVGGHISNGTIKGNNSVIEGAEYGALDNVTLTGSWRNSYSDLSWWGCVAYDSSEQFDNAPKINNALESSIYSIRISKKYGISTPIKSCTRELLGSDVFNWKICGFIANDNFHSIDVTLRDGKIYTITGMIYHNYDEYPVLKNLILNANYKANYCIEHSAGYSNVDIENVSCYNAIKVGVLQYGCEKMQWNKLSTIGCRIGAVVSSTRFNSENPFLDGSRVSMSNMVVLNDCRFMGGNYGLICKGGSNYCLNNCETAYNSLFPLILMNSQFLINNYYSEGDAKGNFWIYENGTKTFADANGNEIPNSQVTNNLGYGRVHPYLIANNIDGILSGTGGHLEIKPYLRSIIYIRNAYLNIQSLFLSYNVRSYEIINITKDTAKLPTERNAAGIDCFILDYLGSTIKLDNISPFDFNSGARKIFPFASVIGVIEGSQHSFQTPTQLLCSSNFNIKFWTDRNSVTNTFGNVTGFYVPRNDIRPSYANISQLNRITSFADYNSDIYSRKRGVSSFTPYNYNSYKISYKGFPLYKIDTTKNNPIAFYYSKDEILSKFKNKNHIKIRAIAYVAEQCDSRIILNVEHKNASWGNILKYTSDNSGLVTLVPGFYDLICIVAIIPKESEFDNWVITLFSFGATNETLDKIYLSDIYFYEVEDGEMAAPYVKSLTLESGTTSLRPFEPFVGQEYFDTTLNKKLIWNGTAWVNLDGTNLQ